MILDIKYYIITITAIFISLGIGIFIGFNMNGEEIFLRQQEELVNSLEDRFNELRLDNINLQDTIRALEKEKEKGDYFIEKAYYELINNKLSGLNIAILQTTEHYYYSDIKNTLEEAGAIIPIHLVFTDKIFYLTDQELNNINDFIGAKLSKLEVIEQVNDDIINFLLNDTITVLMDFMINNEFINLTQYYENKDGISQVIIAGGKHDESNQSTTMIDLGLIKKLHLNNIRAIGVERLDVLYTSIPLYKEIGISTIDNVDTLIGRISLVLVANGRDGSFGEKSFSEALVPLGAI